MIESPNGMINGAVEGKPQLPMTNSAWSRESLRNWKLVIGHSLLNPRAWRPSHSPLNSDFCPGGRAQAVLPHTGQASWLAG